MAPEIGGFGSLQPHPRCFHLSPIGGLALKRRMADMPDQLRIIMMWGVAWLTRTFDFGGLVRQHVSARIG